MSETNNTHQMRVYEYERYLPTAFDSSLTLVEKVNKTIEHLNQIVDGTNDAFEYIDATVTYQNGEIKKLREDFEILKEWLEQDGLEERTEQVLNEWFDNGRLAHIINNDVFNMKADKATFEQFVLSITAQLQQTPNTGNLKLATLLASNQVTKIKVVADSFGVGVGSTGGAEDPTGALIGTTGVREAKKDTPGWVNYFRNYIARKYPNVEFFNASIGGYSMKENGLPRGTGWYGADNDVVVVMMGANDRQYVTGEAEFKSIATQFLANVNATCNYMVVCSQNIPTAEFDENGVLKSAYKISMEQVDKILAEICKEQGYSFVSMYKNIKNVLDKSGMTPSMVVRDLKEGYADYLHPNNEGHLLLWEIFQSETGIMEDSFDIANRKISSKPKQIFDRYTELSLDNPITDYIKGSTTSLFVVNPFAQSESFPGGYGGVLTIVRHINDSFSYQEYYSMQGKTIARRYWSSGAWSSWTLFQPPSTGSFSFKAISGDLADVNGATYFKMNNATPTTVTNLAHTGQGVKTIIFANGNTTLKQGLFKLNGGVDWTPTQFSSITIYKSDLTGAWVEMSRTQI